MYKKFGLFINGQWRAADNGETMAVYSPVTENVLGDVTCASIADTQEAIAAAKTGLANWRSVSAFERADKLHTIADQLAARAEEAKTMISTETGKPILQSGREWGLVVDQFRWYAEQARRIYGRIIESRVPGGKFEVSKQPIGIVGAFTAWNFPAALIARKVAPALAAGCSVIVRPSSQTPGVAMIIFDSIRASNLPDGVVNLIIGSTSTTYTPIMAEKSVRKISLTGSTRIGQQMMRDAADTVKKVSMELGGNAPLIVYDDADIEAVLDVSVPTKFANCGQVCVTPDRLFVHESIHDAFVEGFVKRTRSIVLGDGLDPSVQMGPLINARSLEKALNSIEEALSIGAKLQTGGIRPRKFNKGHFLTPTVITDFDDNAKIFAEENFAPIAAISRFSTDDEVLERANASDMGLSAYAFTKSPQRARRTIAELKSGMVGINSYALAAAEAPFGGTNYSGLGREGGTEGIEDYLDTKLAQIVF